MKAGANPHFGPWSSPRGAARVLAQLRMGDEAAPRRLHSRAMPPFTCSV
jgi:hypothetical protein